MNETTLKQVDTPEKRKAIYEKALQEILADSEGKLDNKDGQACCPALFGQIVAANNRACMYHYYDKAKTYFPEFATWQPTIKYKYGRWFKNTEERVNCLLFCIEMTK